VGLPAKSGVGGGIVAVLPGQFGVGTFSPPLDTQGNSARGIRVCEDLSRLFSLHMFDVDRASHSAIRVSYDGTRVRSKRTRAEDERAILAEEGGCIRAFELQGALTFASMEHISRSVLAEACDCRFLVLDGRRVTRIDPSARSLLLTLMAQLSLDDKRVLLSGFALDLQATIADQMEWPEDCFIDSLDRALEYCEDRVIRADIPEAWEGVLPLERTEIASGLTPGELEVLGGLISERRYSAGDLIIREGDEADALFVLASGSAAATVRVGASGRLRRLGAIGPGVLFGEVALLSGGRRTADVTAEQDCICYVAAIEDILTLQTDHPAIGLKLLLNLGRTLSERLRLANDEIRALEA
jgi:glutaminase